MSLISDSLELLDCDLACEQFLSKFDILKLGKLSPSFFGIEDSVPDLITDPDVSVSVEHTGVVIPVLYD